MRVVTQCGHLVGDTIVQGSATSHMVPVEQADGEFGCVTESCCSLLLSRDINLWAESFESVGTDTCSDMSVSSSCLCMCVQ